MQNLLIFSLQTMFYVYGFTALMLFLKYFIAKSSNASIFLICCIASFIIGYFSRLLFNYEYFKEKNYIITIFLSWILMIIVSSIPFMSLIKVLDLNQILFLSTSFITTTGFHLEYFNMIEDYESLLIWGSISQLIGGFFSIITFILFFLVLFNKHNKLVIFDKKLIIQFLSYYFILFGIYVFVLNIIFKDIFNSFMIASAIISTGGIVGTHGHVLDYYFSENNYLMIYSVLIILSIFILPVFLLMQNKKILYSYYLKIFKRSIFFLIILLLFFTLQLKLNTFSFQENFFIFISFLTTTGLLPNNASNLSFLKELYPLFFVFLFLIITGSFSGGSSGGLKIDRVSILLIKIKEEILKITMRHKVYGIDLIKQGSNQRELNSLFALISFGILTVISVVCILCIDGNSLFIAFVSTISALTNTGDGFLHLNNVDLTDNSSLYLILDFLMICGRFELIGYLLIFQRFNFKN